MEISVIGVASGPKSSNWFSGKVKPLTNSKDLCAISDVHYQGHSWSIVKLIVLGGWVYVYTTIIPHYFQDYGYVDLLAGPGTTHVQETDDVVIGSPFVARNFARNPFKSYVFFETKSEMCKALSERVRLTEGKCRILNSDCNERIRSAFTDEKTHYLVFADNEGFDVVWNTIEVMLRAKTDILINFPTSMVPRTAADTRTSSALDRFYGDKSWLEAQDREGYLQIYLQKLKNRFKELRRTDAYVSNIRVGTESYFYDIILVCKMGRFVEAWDWLKKKWDWRSPRIIENTLDILMNRATGMDLFMNDLNKEVTQFEPKPPKRKKNKELTEYISKP